VRRGKLAAVIAFSNTSCLPLGRQLVVVNSYSLLNELCNDKRFPKLVTGAVKEISALVHDGLFTYVRCGPSHSATSIDIHPGPTPQTRIGASPVRPPSRLYLNSDPLIHFTDRLLMPVFGTAAIRDMFPAMEDIVSQLVTKWERFAVLVQRWRA
jgi:cytochrome P450/NADPH-cytochrome P450 reductase